MKITINKRTVEQLPFSEGKTLFYLDRTLQGFGVRVGKTTKAFYAESKVKGQAKRITLGRFPLMTCEQARKQALDTLADLAQGRYQIGEQHNQQKKDVIDRVSSMTLRSLMDAYLKFYKNDRSAVTLRDYPKQLRLFVSDWMDRPFMEISEAMVLDRFQARKTTAPVGCTNAFKKVSALFNFAMQQYQYPERTSSGEEGLQSVVSHNPINVLTRRQLWCKSKRRKTVIPKAKLSAWLEAVHQIKETGGPYTITVCDFMLTLLFTGMRFYETSVLTWSDVDLNQGVIRLRAEVVKAKRDCQLPMTSMVREIMTERSQKRTSHWVFPSSRSDTRPIVWTQKVRLEIEAASGALFSHHDLRRTFASVGEVVGLSAYNIKRLMNHTLEGDVTGGYICEAFDDDGLRTASQRITDFILDQWRRPKKLELVIQQDRRYIHERAESLGLNLTDYLAMLKAS